MKFPFQRPGVGANAEFVVQSESWIAAKPSSVMTFAGMA